MHFASTDWANIWCNTLWALAGEQADGRNMKGFSTACGVESTSIGWRGTKVTGLGQQKSCPSYRLRWKGHDKNVLCHGLPADRMWEGG